MNNRSAEGYSTRLGFGEKPALFISDLQNAYVNPNHARGMDCSSAIGIINDLIERFRELNLPIIFSIIEFDQADLSSPNIWLQKIPRLAALEKGSEDAQLTDLIDLDPLTDHLICKQNPSAFYETPLAAILKKEQVDTLIITGATTSGCVRATTVDCMQHGFRPIVIKEATADRWPDAHEQALFDMDAKYADVISVEALTPLFE